MFNNHKREIEELKRRVENLESSVRGLHLESQMYIGRGDSTPVRNVVQMILTRLELKLSKRTAEIELKNIGS